MILEIYKKLNFPEFDYNYLMSVLEKYRNPRNKISNLIKSGHIIRVKKGLYVLGEDNPIGVYSKEILANLIYGPSYISLDSALSFYRFIPEKVEIMTSVTCKKDKFFYTPVGEFTYKYCNLPILCGCYTNFI